MRKKDSTTRMMKRDPVVLRLSKLITLLLLTCHWMGSVWWAISTNERQQHPDLTSTWGPSAWLIAQHSFLQWGHSFLWGASIGTGFVLFDVTPATAAEVIVTCGCVFFGLGMNTVILSTTTSLLQSIDSRNAFGRQRLENISNYLDFKHVRPEVPCFSFEFVHASNFTSTYTHPSEIRARVSSSHPRLLTSSPTN